MSIFNLSLPVANTLFNVSNVGAIVGALLVFVSAAGLFWTGGIRERYADERTERNEAETETAKATAATANERAATANQNAALANERTEELRQSNLQLQTELEKERTERLRLEASITPRILSERQRALLIAALQAAPQPITVEVSLVGDEEARNYGHSIVDALGSAGVKGSTNTIGITVPPLYGVLLTLQKGNAKSLSIKTAFEKAQIPVVVSFGDVGALDARVLVGLRPLGPAR